MGHEPVTGEAVDINPPSRADCADMNPRLNLFHLGLIVVIVICQQPQQVSSSSTSKQLNVTITGI